jgi:hypothetical protein
LFSLRKAEKITREGFVAAKKGIESMERGLVKAEKGIERAEREIEMVVSFEGVVGILVATSIVNVRERVCGAKRESEIQNMFRLKTLNVQNGVVVYRKKYIFIYNNKGS